jgi:2,4-dienoyl-CoA reductase-like NADH-dependent reductase (Old Yellow Enzyme family)/thioredoxin reductase
VGKVLEHLIKPGRIGSMTLKNRMVVTAMGVNLGEADATCGERIIAYHERQARGGAALIITGVASVAWPHGAPIPGPIGLSDDRFLPGLSALAEAVHRHGAKIAAQLHHGGINAVQDTREGRALWVPSYPLRPGYNDMAEGMLQEEMAAFAGAGKPELRVVNREDIAYLVSTYADAAERAKRAGLDAVEIHAGHGYILSGFLSPVMNQRDDEYGGSLENRARFLLEVIGAIRDRVGRDFPVWVKLDCGEYGKQEGISLADARRTAQMAEAAGVDAITASAYHDTNRGALHSESNIPFESERMIPDATAIREALSIPVITSGRVEPESGDQHIRQGHFDFLAMGRKILADPDLPNKIIAGTPEQIRPCVYCYCCASQIYVVKPVKCAVNPETAFERERALIVTDKPRRLAVAGGGPAGMEAARRLSQRGFQVDLLEAGGRLGGTLQFASIAYQPNEHLLDWLRLQIEQSSVTVHLNTPATAERLRALGTKEVIVATGARREMPQIPGSDRDFVFSGDEMRALVLGGSSPGLRRKTSALDRALVSAGARTGITAQPGLVRLASKLWLPLGKQIAIIGAELVGLELAEFLAERGRDVTVIDSGPEAGRGLYVVRRMRLLEELRNLGVELIRQAEDIAIGDHEVSYTNFRGQQRAIEADHVIVAKGAEGDHTLAEKLRTAGFTVHTIGDCNGVGYIEGAMESAAELAVKL